MMPNHFLYPGNGKALRQVTGGTGNTPTSPKTTTIANNGFSELIAAHEGLEMFFEFIFGAAATGNVLIEKVADKDATVTGETFATVAVAAQLSANYNAAKPLSGYFRIKNTSGQTMTVYYNQGSGK